MPDKINSMLTLMFHMLITEISFAGFNDIPGGGQDLGILEKAVHCWQADNVHM